MTGNTMVASAKAKSKAQDDTKKEGVTVDWIILTAAVLGLFVVGIASVQAGSEGLAAHMGSYIISSN